METELRNSEEPEVHKYAQRIEQLGKAINTLSNCGNDTVTMPKTLTYENGAKALFMGEFYETTEVYAGEDHEAETGEETVTREVPVSWTTIKNIYAKAVKHLGQTPNQ